MPPSDHLISNECVYSKLVEIEKLIPNPKNRNNHSQAQIDRLCKLIKHQGFRHPIIVSTRSGYIVAGHGRLLAAKKLKMQKVPADYQDFADEASEYAFLVGDNAIAAWAELDLSGINEDVTEWGPDFDLDLLGIDGFTVDVADRYADKDPDEVPKVGQSFVKIGDLFTLGNHRLLCGDSTKAEEVARLMNGEKADMVFTSPPYNAGATPGGLSHSRHRKYLNWEADAKTDEEYAKFLSDFLEASRPFSRIQCVNLALLEGGKRGVLRWLGHQADYFLQDMVWVKKSGSPCPVGTITGRHEWVFIFSTEKTPNKKIPTKNFSHLFSVIEADRNEDSHAPEIHRAGFSIAFCEYVLNSLSESDSSILEPFCGSGSTLIACEKINRKCYGIEIDPIYCGVILDRWAKFTGLDPVRQDGVSWSTIKSKNE